MSPCPSRLLGVAILAGCFTSAGRAATIERVCTTSAHDPHPVVLRIDTDMPALTENGHRVRNGRAEDLPDLVFFTGNDGKSFVWGARNTRTGMVYYRYQFDLAAELLTYDAEGLHTQATCAEQSSL